MSPEEQSKELDKTIKKTEAETLLTEVNDLFNSVFKQMDWSDPEGLIITIPWLEPNDENSRSGIRKTIALAKQRRVEQKASVEIAEFYEQLFEILDSRDTVKKDRIEDGFRKLLQIIELQKNMLSEYEKHQFSDSTKEYFELKKIVKEAGILKSMEAEKKKIADNISTLKKLMNPDIGIVDEVNEETGVPDEQMTEAESKDFDAEKAINEVLGQSTSK